MYAPQSVNTVGATAKNTYIPAAWHSASSPNFTGKSLYNGVVKPYCRTCHVSANDPTLDFDSKADFVNKAGLITLETCNQKKMPHAERVQKKFWQSGARAYITNGLPQTYTNGKNEDLKCTPN
jgi:hypothetical protein